MTEPNLSQTTGTGISRRSILPVFVIPFVGSGDLFEVQRDMYRLRAGPTWLWTQSVIVEGFTEVWIEPEWALHLYNLGAHVPRDLELYGC